MRKSGIVWLIVAGMLVLLGGVVFVVGFILNGGFTKADMKTSSYEITDEFKDIAVDTTTADVIFVYAKDGVARVECDENPGVEKHHVSVKDGVLTVEREDLRRWYKTIFSFGSSPRITVYLPEQELGALKVDLSTGDVSIPDRQMHFESILIDTTTGDVSCNASAKESITVNVTTGDIEMNGCSAGTVSLKSTSSCDVEINGVDCTELSIKVGTGSVELENVTCQTLTASGTTGDMELERVRANEMSIKRTTGDVSFERCEASVIRVDCGTGDVTGSLIGEMIVHADSTTGRISVPKCTSGGICEVSTTTGDIILETVGK